MSEQPHMPDYDEQAYEYGDETYSEEYETAQPVSVDESPADRGFWQSRVVRIVLGLLVLGVLVVVVALVAVLSYRESRNKPLKVGTYPGAQMVSEERLYDGYDHQQYVSTDPVEKIEEFFDRQDDMKCQRQYASVTERPGEELLREGYLYTSCVIDHSTLGITQYTKVVIQPQQDGAGNLTGQVVIDVQRHWGK